MTETSEFIVGQEVDEGKASEIIEIFDFLDTLHETFKFAIPSTVWNFSVQEMDMKMSLYPLKNVCTYGDFFMLGY